MPLHTETIILIDVSLSVKHTKFSLTCFNNTPLITIIGDNNTTLGETPRAYYCITRAYYCITYTEYTYVVQSPEFKDIQGYRTKKIT